LRNEIAVVTHTDTDGVTAAAQIRSVFPHARVAFPEWVEYGVSRKILESLAPADRLFVLDMGLDPKSVRTICDLRDRFGEITVIDHHPHDPADRERLDAAGVEVIYDPDYCASALTFLYLERAGLVQDSSFAAKWAVIGTYSDVFDTREKSAALLSRLIGRHPELSLELVTWDPSTRSERGIPAPAMFGAYINAGRYLHYHHGARVALEAAAEMERHGDVFLLREDFSKNHLEARYPHCHLLQRWHERWLSERNRVFERGNITYLKIRVGPYTFGLAFVNHEWDIGGYVAAKKANDSPQPQYAFAVNYGVPGPRAKISARAPRDAAQRRFVPELNLGDVMRTLSTVDPSFVGGGHEAAGSATFPKEVSEAKVTRLLKAALARSLSGKI